ncbi:ADP-ribosylglycohydrolase family protein [Lentzea cavernae]|uniref:ADP-ribosylglycohydrolase family protein n=1 Tax=Lentzea cavernae TaxID=2020703 RepID=UPI00174D733A|nr:ADP-ribosylglycohydrolase family protein [Lentzea cavernae]
MIALTPVEQLLHEHEDDVIGFGQNAAHGELLLPGEALMGEREVLEVYTDESRLPAGVEQWIRLPLHTILSRLVASKPKLHVNAGQPFEAGFDFVELAGAAAEHMRTCGCGERPTATHEAARWLDGDGRRFFPVSHKDNSRLRGCLLGGAIGDALGADTENLPMEVVRERHGPDGITDLPEKPDVTDDTQMTLFTFEAVIRAHVRERLTGERDITAVTQNAYQRWLHTQKTPWEKARGVHSTVDEPDGWLISHRDLFRMRAPGLTCTSALQEYARTGEQATISQPVNNSKGCGGVMRVAPIALADEDPAVVFALAAANAVLTHGHPSGYLSAGVFAVLVHQLLRGKGLLEALDVAVGELVRREGHEEVVAGVEHAVELAALGNPSVERVEELGRGGVGDTALAIALYSTLVTDDPNEALLVSVNHGGDNDSTASMCGNLAGALHGVGKIRPDWVRRVQFRDVADRMVADWELETSRAAPVGQEWFVRYPPS